MAHDQLGLALLEAGRIAEAADAFRAALRIDPRLAPARDNLGRALIEGGELDEALRWLRRPRRDGPPDRGRRPDPPPGKDRHPSPAPEAERLQALDQRLSGVLRGADRPADAAELPQFARLAFIKRHYATAARLWKQALSTKPALADDFAAERRYHAACAAALAGGPDDRDRSSLDEASRRGWLRQAGEWLGEELRAYDRVRTGGPPQDRAADCPPTRPLGSQPRSCRAPRRVSSRLRRG